MFGFFEFFQLGLGGVESAEVFLLFAFVSLDFLVDLAEHCFVGGVGCCGEERAAAGGNSVVCVWRLEGVDGSGGCGAGDGQQEELEGAQHAHHFGFRIVVSSMAIASDDHKSLDFEQSADVVTSSCRLCFATGTAAEAIATMLMIGWVM